MDRGAWLATVYGITKSQGMTERACTVLMLATYFEMYQKIR